jgi:hypothetical protein
MNQSEIEAVARAMSELQDGARGWGREPERLKVRFRRDAQTAIAMLDEAEWRICASQSSIHPRDAVGLSNESHHEQF